MSPVTVVMALMTIFVLLAPVAMAMVLVTGGVRRAAAGAPVLSAVPAPADREASLRHAA